MEMQIVKIEKRIKADRKRLFKAWLDPSDFSRWFLPGEKVGIGNVALDPRPGGYFKIDMMINGQVRPHEGSYVEITEPSKLVFTWKSWKTGGRDTLVTITFVPEGESTLITLIHEQLPDAEACESHTHGWTGILSGLAGFFEN